jgi:hypothetical protein
MIEKVIILKTLKSGKTIWEEGQVLFPPLPPDIIQEIDMETGTVKALYTDSSKPKLRRRKV